MNVPITKLRDWILLGRRMGRWSRGALACALTLMILAPSAAGRDAGTLPLNMAVPMKSNPTTCPPGVSALLCARRTGVIAAPGLGQVTESFLYVVLECSGLFQLERTTAQLTVAGKGTIEFALDPSTQCFTSALVADRVFTITGGTGFFAGAYGSGTVQHNAAYTLSGGSAGTDTWSGSLVVPEREFDLKPPTITAANKVVRVRKGANRVKVRYKVSARDDVDGNVPVACKPKSGSRFKIGRTLVRCSATDTSANTKAAQLRVTVRR